MPWPGGPWMKGESLSQHFPRPPKEGDAPLVRERKKKRVSNVLRGGKAMPWPRGPWMKGESLSQQ